MQLPAFEALLPSYYGHGKFPSFARQLNYYGKVDQVFVFLVVPGGRQDGYSSQESKPAEFTGGNIQTCEQIYL